MALARRADATVLLAEFQGMFSEFSGASVQAFDARGNPVPPSSPLSELCTFFQRYPETETACRKDCFRKATTCRDSRGILAARCYAGLSYRVVPIRKRNQPHAVIIVGRVLTEVFGGEQCLGFIERYKLSQDSFMKSLAGVRSMSSPDLDRLAGFVRRVAVTSVAAETRFEHRASLLKRQSDLIDFSRQATAFHERSPGQARGMLQFLGRTLSIPALALVLHAENSGKLEVHSSVGIGENILDVLATSDLAAIIGKHGQDRRLYLTDRQQLADAGLERFEGPLAVHRLKNGSQTVGYLIASGAALSPGDLRLLDSAAPFITSWVVHQQCRMRAEQKDEEARLLGLMAEKCLTAHTVEELLPLALEAAMSSLRARRGSIFLADEERGRITASAVRGAHAPISGTIEALRPGSVSHQVFYNRRPLLVQNAEQESGLERERQFPYATRSFVSVPLRENGHALGVLHLTEREGEGIFTQRDLSLLEMLGLQASGAIRKVRLEDEVQSLRVTSSIDHLTGAYNRRYLEEHLEVEFQRASRFNQPLAVAMFDLDGFKSLNDELGHDAGDRVLKEVAAAIRNQLRAVDILVRYGGDEFVLVLPGTGKIGALNTVEKVRARIGGAAVPESWSADYSHTITVSAGISTFPDTATGVDDLLRHADLALMQAKKSGRNTALLWNA